MDTYCYEHLRFAQSFQNFRWPSLNMDHQFVKYLQILWAESQTFHQDFLLNIENVGEID